MYDFDVRNGRLLFLMARCSTTSDFLGLMHRTVFFLLMLLRMKAGMIAGAAARKGRVRRRQIGDGTIIPPQTPVIIDCVTERPRTPLDGGAGRRTALVLHK